MSSIESLLSDLKAVVKFVQIKYSKAVFARIYGRKGKEMNRLNLEFSFPFIFLVLDKSIHESIIQTQLKVSIHYQLDPDTNEGEFKLLRKSFRRFILPIYVIVSESGKKIFKLTITRVITNTLIDPNK